MPGFASMRPRAGSPAPNREKDECMANTKSAQKAARQALRRTNVNQARRSRVKTEVRRVEEAILSGDAALARETLGRAEPVLARSAQKGVMHKRTASRKVSRLTARVVAMAAK